MGICGSKSTDKGSKQQNGDDEFAGTKKEKQKEVKTTGEFLEALDFVTENKVRITKEYNVLSPPLGRGISISLFMIPKKP